MFYEPVYCENIIVGVKWKGEFNWYVSEKEMWFMNETKFSLTEEQRAMLVEIPDDPRYQLEIVDENTVDIFMPRIEKFKVPVDELCELLEFNILTEEFEDAYFDFLPSLYIDFDEKLIVSMFPEPTSFEYYTPDGWEGRYEVFILLVDKKYWYWYKDGEALIKYEERER